MKKSLLRIFVVASVAACATTPQQQPQAAQPSPPQSQAQAKSVAQAEAAVPPTPPVALRKPYSTTLHGHTLVDEYRWLREKDTPAVVDYLKAENRYTQTMLAPTEKLQQRLYDEMLARMKQTDVSVPVRDHGYFYYDRTVEGLQYPIYCRKSVKGAAADDLTGKTATAPEEVLLDENEIAKTNKFVSVSALDVSDDNSLLAYSLDLTGFRQFTLHFKDLSGKRTFEEAIPRVTSVAWAADGKTIFYGTEDAVSKRSNQIHRHVVGTDPAKDALVYEEKDELFDTYVYRSRSRDFIMIFSSSKMTTEERFLSAKKPSGTFTVLEPRRHDVRYYSEDHGGDFYIRTDAPATAGGDKARNFRLVKAPVASPGRAHWKEVLAHDDKVMLEHVFVFADRLVLSESVDALPRLVVMPLDKKGNAAGKAETITMPEPVYAVFPDGNPEYATPAFRFHFQSPVTPDSVYDWDSRTHALVLLKRQEVLGGFDGTRYKTERIHATAADGTQIPLSLVYRKDLTPATAHPALLYGYGSYGISMPMTFSSTTISLLDRGMVYAVGHIRGGGDLGTRWHEQGRMQTKMNTFTDFIACAEALVKSGWTTSDKLAIQGGSAGGLLMGAVTNLRPDLFHAVVAQVPFVDVINTMLDESLPLTVGEFEEWGNPKKQEDFDYMIKYSPYDNVAKKAYPSILVMTSYNDSQVMYWEPAKWVAKLRANKTDRNPLLLRINMDPAGHGGQSGRYNRLREVALVDAFVLTQLGIND